MVEPIRNTLKEEMKFLWETFVYCRAHFPFVDDGMVGQTVCETAPYYQNKGFYVRFSFRDGLTKDKIISTKRTGHWINQNFVIRLFALLEYYKVISNTIKIDFSINGANELDLIRRLRNVFGHASGTYNCMDKEHRTLIEKINNRYKLELDIENQQEFPLPIDSVLEPLLNGCIAYVEEFKNHMLLDDSN